MTPAIPGRHRGRRTAIAACLAVAMAASLALAALATGLLAKNGWITRLPGHLSGWTSTRDFPAMARTSFQERWKARRKGSIQ